MTDKKRKTASSPAMPSHPVITGARYWSKAIRVAASRRDSQIALPTCGERQLSPLDECGSNAKLDHEADAPDQRYGDGNYAEVSGRQEARENDQRNDLHQQAADRLREGPCKAAHEKGS